jgi:hypothetical protein
MEARCVATWRSATHLRDHPLKHGHELGYRTLKKCDERAQDT